MSVRNLLTRLHTVVENGGADYLVILEDEDEEIYALTDTNIDPAHEAVVLQVDTRPLEMR